MSFSTLRPISISETSLQSMSSQTHDEGPVNLNPRVVLVPIGIYLAT